MARYQNLTSKAVKPTPPEWGTLTEAEVQKAVLMEYPRDAICDRYILKEDVERLESKGWKVKDPEYIHAYAPVQTKAKSKAGRKREV